MSQSDMFRVLAILVVVIMALSDAAVVSAPSLFERCDVPEEGFAWRLIDTEEADCLARAIAGEIPRTARELGAFADLSVGIDSDEVIRRVGVPDAFAGSGISYNVYILNDCSQVWLAILNNSLSWGLHTIGKEFRDLDLKLEETQKFQCGAAPCKAY